MKYLKSFFEILLVLIKTFPKVFSKLFGFVPYIGVWIKYLPEMIELTKVIYGAAKKGITDLQIKRDLKRINRAFEKTDRQQAAQELRDVFRT